MSSPETAVGVMPDGGSGAAVLSGAGEVSKLDRVGELERELTGFDEFGRRTEVVEFPLPGVSVPVYVGEFWTSRQRAAHSLHEVSYRACFKPQLPRFFVTRLTSPGDLVHDPFMGRGTTLLEAALLDRRVCGSDVNPLSSVLLAPRLDPPSYEEVEERLGELDLDTAESESDTANEDLLVFYHPQTLRQLTRLRSHLLRRRAEGRLDRVDRWIRMVATNRLTGHSPGFFSVYTLPPNQAASLRAQRRINERRNQTPPLREVGALILRKTRSLLSRMEPDDTQRLASSDPLLLTASADDTPEIADDSVRLVVTSPPFLDIVNYRADNWLRCWFNGLDEEDDTSGDANDSNQRSKVGLWQLRNANDWRAAMTRVLCELRRVLVPGGFVAFEVGEVRSGKLLLETFVVPAALDAGLEPLLVIVNDQQFTKTSNCWGVDNRKKGTNTNRIVLMRKPE